MHSYSVNNETITVVINGAVHNLVRGTRLSARVLKALRDPKVSDEKLTAVLTGSTLTPATFDGATCREDGVLEFAGIEIGAPIVAKFQLFEELGLKQGALIRFLRNLARNPSRRCVTELYSFMEHGNMPVTEDGCFLAYKAIREDWTDKHTGTFVNKVGRTLTMPRNAVCDDPDEGCSKGFHAGSLSYALGFRNVGANDRLVIVKINPEHVVSVPKDCSWQKLRTCQYKVIGEYRDPLAEAFAGRGGKLRTQAEEEKKLTKAEKVASALAAFGKQVKVRKGKGGRLYISLK